MATGFTYSTVQVNQLPKRRLKIKGVSATDTLPEWFQNTIINGAHFVGFIMYGCSYPGHFLLRVSVEGYQSYERPITFTEGLVHCELRLQPIGATRKDEFEVFATLSGKVVDQQGQPFRGALIESMNAGRRNYQDYSNEGGYYLLEVPKGTNTIRITGADITPIVFENYRIESNHANLDVTVCRNCKPLEFESGAINRPTQSAAGNTGKMIALGFDAFSLNL